MRKSKEGFAFTEEHRDKISKANSGEGNAMYGTKMSEEHKAILKEARSKIVWPTGENHHSYGKKESEEAKEARAKKIGKTVLDTSTGFYYDTAVDATKALDIPHKRLLSYLIRSRKNKTNMIYV